MAQRTQTVSRIRPVTARDNETVIWWSFTLTITEGDRQIHDTIKVPQDPPETRRPLAAWKRAEIEAVIHAVATDRAHPHVKQLHRQLDARLAVHEHMDFDLSKVKD